MVDEPGPDRKGSSSREIEIVLGRSAAIGVANDDYSGARGPTTNLARDALEPLGRFRLQDVTIGVEQGIARKDRRWNRRSRWWRCRGGRGFCRSSGGLGNRYLVITIEWVDRHRCAAARSRRNIRPCAWGTRA